MNKKIWKKNITNAIDLTPPSKEELNFYPGKKSDFDLIEDPNDRLDPKKLRLASVLIAITNTDNPTVVLTKRSLIIYISWSKCFNSKYDWNNFRIIDPWNLT